MGRAAGEMRWVGGEMRGGREVGRGLVRERERERVRWVKIVGREGLVGKREGGKGWERKAGREGERGERGGGLREGGRG